ncbi:MAG: hypothetical protein ACRDJH_24135 [Thermomicrobiales bacterium]
MRGLRIVLRGMKDTFEHLLPFTMASLGWWLCVFLIVPAPGATIALFRLTDPRVSSELERQSIRQSVDVIWANLRRGWGVAALTVPILLILVINLATVGSAARLAILVPLWAILLLLGVAATLSAFALAALFDQPALDAVKHSLLLTGARLPRALFVVVLLWLIVFLGTVLVVPLFMFLPAAVAAAANRMVLDGLGVEIYDPLAPTEERLREEHQKRESSRFGP